MARKAAALATDLPRLSGGRFWGDGATYYAMAASLAEDGDIRYEARDVLRIRREYAFGFGRGLADRSAAPQPGLPVC